MVWTLSVSYNPIFVFANNERRRSKNGPCSSTRDFVTFNNSHSIPNVETRACIRNRPVTPQKEQSLLIIHSGCTCLFLMKTCGFVIDVKLYKNCVISRGILDILFGSLISDESNFLNIETFVYMLQPFAMFRRSEKNDENII